MARLKPVLLLGGLYFTQGLPFGFQATALPLYLRANGVSLTHISFLGVLAAPWLLKALWAPWVDRFGQRRTWVGWCQAGLAASSAAASFFTPQSAGGLGGLLALVFTMNLFAATQDIATDGWAVDLLRGRQLGPGNAAQVVGYKLGMLTSGGLLVAGSARFGWSGTFWAMAGLSAAMAAVVVAVGRPSARAALPARPPPRERPTLGGVYQAAFHTFRVPGAAALLLAVGTYKLGESMADTLFKPLLVDAGFEPWRLGVWLGTYGLAASVAGSLSGGALAAQWPLWKALTWTAALRVVPLAAQAWLVQRGTYAPHWVVAVTVAENFFGGALTTAMFAFMMSRVDPRIGATHFTLLASVEVLGKSPGAWASGPLAERVGYAPVFALAVLLSVGFLALLPRLRPAPTTG